MPRNREWLLAFKGREFFPTKRFLIFSSIKDLNLETSTLKLWAILTWDTKPELSAGYSSKTVRMLHFTTNKSKLSQAFYCIICSPVIWHPGAAVVDCRRVQGVWVSLFLIVWLMQNLQRPTGDDWGADSPVRKERSTGDDHSSTIFCVHNKKTKSRCA